LGMAQKITQDEYETHVVPVAMQNWHDAHGLLEGERPLTDAEYAEIEEWAAILRHSFQTGELDAYWRI
jgi:hypothetical protein